MSKRPLMPWTPMHTDGACHACDKRIPKGKRVWKHYLRGLLCLPCARHWASIYLPGGLLSALLLLMPHGALLAWSMTV